MRKRKYEVELIIKIVKENIEKAYANEFSQYFSPQLYGRLQWVVYPESLIPDVESEAQIVTKWRARPIKK